MHTRIAAAFFVALLALAACSGPAREALAMNPAQPIAGFAASGAAAPVVAQASPSGGTSALASSPMQVALAGSAATPVSAPSPAAMPLAGSPSTTSAGNAAATPMPSPARQPTATVMIAVPNVPPGGEDTRCVHVRLPGNAPLNVIKLHNQLSNGSHHYILTAVSEANASERPLERCAGFGGSVTGAPLSITQAHEDFVQLPEGVGYHLNAGHVLRLELHYINTGDHAIDISASTELFAAAPGAQIQEGAVMLIGTADFNIPAHSSKETAAKFLALPAGMEDVKFYAITGHTHRYGTNVKVSLASAPTTATLPLYAPQHFDWESPETAQLSPHVSVPKGGGFMLQCAWNNTGDSALRWGESATAEMCFFWGYYYPRKNVFSIVVDNLDQNLLKQIASMPPAP